MTPSLRMRVVEAAKSAIGASFVEQMGWGESNPMAALEAYAIAQGQAEAALDAALDCLTENADEWSAAELELHKRLGLEGAWHSRHEDELAHLIEVLREPTDG